MIVIHGFIFDALLRGHAYLDPGSGSILIQVLVAGLLGGAFLIKTYWRKLKGLFTRKQDQDQDISSDTTDDDR
jgi:hypothetical protein